MEKNKKTKEKKAQWIVPPRLTDKVREFENLYKTIKNKPVIICGSSGVGKSLFVHIFERLYIEEHKEKQPIVRLNCAAFGSELLLSELFGHVKGAFTGANSDKVGHISQAKDGVLILEEIGELPKTGQAQLLTFIEDGYFYKVGSTEREEANVQIIATTNKPQQHFREDFWYRFFPFYVPSLYKRREDILYYLGRMFPDITKQLMPWEILTLLCYNWPGNVREIERVGQLIEWHTINKKDFSYERDEKYAWMNHLIWDHVGVPGDYTGLDGTKSHLIYNNMKKFGVDVVLLEQVLGELDLGLSPMSTKKPPFSKLANFEYRFDPSINERFGVSTYFGVHAFDSIWHGLMYYCDLFFQDFLADKNLLFIEEGNLMIPIYLPSSNFKNASDKHFKLEKQVLEFLMKKKLPHTIKRLPDPSSTEFHNLMTSLDDANDNDLETFKKVIGGMKQDELTTLHYHVAMERVGGVKAKAARLLGVDRSTFCRTWEKLNARKSDHI